MDEVFYDSHMVLVDTGKARAFIGLLIALAFLAQSVIPSGYMPAFGTGKVFEMSICHGADQMTILVDEHMQPVKSPGNQSPENSKSCVFASLSAKHLAFQSFLFQQIEYLTYIEFVERSTGQESDNAPAKSYLAQAPPALHSII